MRRRPSYICFSLKKFPRFFIVNKIFLQHDSITYDVLYISRVFVYSSPGVTRYQDSLAFNSPVLILR